MVINHASIGWLCIGDLSIEKYEIYCVFGLLGRIVYLKQKNHRMEILDKK